MKKAIYGFSGDPITFGHIDIIERALSIFGELVVGIGVNPTKKYFFTLEERRQIAAASLQYLPQVKVISFRGLLVDYAYEQNIATVIRGIRNSEDLNYELMLHQVGESQRQGIDTIYFPAKQDLMHISSGAAKALQLEQGLIHEYVPLCAKQKLEEKLSGQYLVSITGEMGVGKSYLSRRLQALGKEKGLEVHLIDVDKIGHAILGQLEAPLYREFRQQVGRRFGGNLLDEAGFIDRRALGKIIFQNPKQLQEFNQMIYQPLLLQLRRELYGKRGLIVLDTALISETGMNYLSNNNIILVEADPQVQEQRLLTRGYQSEQIQHRLKTQFTAARKRDFILDRITKNHHGKLWQVNNNEDGDDQAVQELLAELEHFFALKA